jgi:hypothetical protein
MNYHLFGDKFLEVLNEPEAFVLSYFLKSDAGSPAKITVKDAAGKVVRELEGPSKAGMNRAQISLAGGGGRGFGGGGGAGGRGRGGPPTPPLAVGDYTVTVDVAGQTLTKPARVRERIVNR